MTYAALAAIRKWRFKPAEASGRPIEVFYSPTVRFDVRGCDDKWMAAQTRLGEPVLTTLESPGERSLPATITILDVAPSPEEPLERPRLMRLRVEYQLPRSLLTSGEILLIPQFEQDREGTTFVLQAPHARTTIDSPSGTTLLYYDLEQVWNHEKLARPIRLWVYAVARDPTGEMDVVGVAGPVVYDAQPAAASDD